MKPVKSGRVRKEEIFVGIASPDNITLDYHDVSRFIGMSMPYKNPKATCALRVTADSASFSLLHLTKAAASKISQKPVELPRGPLVRLEKHALLYKDLQPNQILLEINEDKHIFTFVQDPNGVITLDGEVTNIELPKSAIQVAIYLKSPLVDRMVALGFIGHLGRPGDPDTILRVAAKILRSATGITHFRALTGFETVEVPAAPRMGTVRVTKKSSDRAEVILPVWFFSNDLPPLAVANGKVKIDINLDTPGSGNARLLINFTPSEELAPSFDLYRNVMNETVSKFLLQHLGDSEIRSIAADIALGEVTPGTVMRLRDALVTIPEGLDFTTTLFQPHTN
jgi:hypothetical protein